MDVSVIVPSRNRPAMLETTIRSVLRQRDLAFEVIVVDDASTDCPRRVIEMFSDHRLQLISHEVARGPNAARNSGARQARGEWVAFVDDDDIWSPDKLSRQLRAAEQDGRQWVYAGSVNVSEHLEVIHGIPPPSPAEVVAALPRYNAIPASASNVVVRRKYFLAEGGFNENLRVCEEWDLWLRLARLGPPAWVPSPLVAYRMHAGNASLDAAAILEGVRQIERLHGTRVDWGRLHWWIAQLCLRSGRRTKALEHYIRAALRGRHREVGADLAAQVRRRLRRRPGGPMATARCADSAWEQEAVAWIQEFRKLEQAALDREQ